MPYALFLADSRPRALEFLRQIAPLCSELLTELALRVSPRWLATTRPPVSPLSSGMTSLLQQTDLHVAGDVLLFTLALLALVALAAHLPRTFDRRRLARQDSRLFHAWSLQ